MFFKLNSLIRFCLTIFLAFLGVITWQSLAMGQFSLATDSNSTNLPPIDVMRYGNLEVTWVKSPISNQKLLQIAAPTVIDRANIQLDNLPVEIRAKNIEALLWLTLRRIRGDVFSRIFESELTKDSALTSAEVSIATLNNLPVVQVKYANSSRPLIIATVTQTDSTFYSQTPEQIAQDWQEILQQEIARIEYLALPSVIRRRLAEAIAILLGMLAVSGIIGAIYWLLGRRVAKLQFKQNEIIEASRSTTAELPSEVSSNANQTEPATANTSNNFLDLHWQQTKIQRRLGRYNLLRWLLIWLIILGCYLSIYIITTRLPILMRWSEAILAQPLKFLAIWFLVSLLVQISKAFIQRSITTWKTNPHITFGESQRKSLRLTTVATALEGLTTFIIVSLGIIMTLAIFNISASSILAGGAVIGLAISFGMQNLVKDVVNGCLIILEDRFAVGDVIIVNDMGGFVEGFNLRITQLRNPEGQLITIPNSAIAEVRNLTRLWSRVDFTIEVAYENDPDKVLKVLQNVASEMYHSPEWHDKLPDPPEILGIDNLSHAGMLVRVWIKTAPLQQWLVGREYRLRVRRAFAEHNIVIGRPQWISYSKILNGKEPYSLSI